MSKKVEIARVLHFNCPRVKVLGIGRTKFLIYLKKSKRKRKKEESHFKLLVD